LVPSSTGRGNSPEDHELKIIRFYFITEKETEEISEPQKCERIYEIIQANPNRKCT
jgi:hypothetical protein